MSDEETCACGHLWTEHGPAVGCWHGWEHDPTGVAITDGCGCELVHARLSR